MVRSDSRGNLASDFPSLPPNLPLFQHNKNWEKVIVCSVELGIVGVEGGVFCGGVFCGGGISKKSRFGRLTFWFFVRYWGVWLSDRVIEERLE